MIETGNVVGLFTVERRAGPMKKVDQFSALAGRGIEGDRYLCGQIKCRNQTGYGEDPIRVIMPRNDPTSFWCWRPTLYSSGWASIHSTAT